MRLATDKQIKYLRFLASKTGYKLPDSLTRKQASQLIDQLLRAKPRQTELPLPPPEPLPLDDPVIPPEIVEFKRWATEVYRRGEQNIAQLCKLYDEKFGNPFKT